MENLISKDKPMPLYAEKDQPVIPVAMSLLLPEDLRANEEYGNRFWVAIKGDQWHIARRRLVGSKLETVESWARRARHFRDVCVVLFVHGETKAVKPADCRIRSTSFMVDNEANREKLSKLAKECVEDWIADGTLVFVEIA